MTAPALLLTLSPFVVPFVVLAIRVAAIELQGLGIRRFKVGGLTFVQIGRFSASFCMRRAA